MIPERISVSSLDMLGYTHYKYGDGEVIDAQVRIIITFKGVLDEARLKRAVRLAFDVEPVIGCSLVERPFCPHWQRCADLEDAFEFRTVDPSDQETGIDYLLAPLDPFSGPQVNVGLFRSDFDTLYIKMTHIVADGGASIEYLQLLSGIYRRLEREPEYRPVINLRGSRSSFQVLRHVKLRKLLSSCAHVSVLKPAWELPAVGNGKTSPSFFIRRIGPERLSRIKVYARGHGVTIGDIVLTAYYRALFEVLDPPENMPLPLLVPVNIRRYIPGGHGEGICGLTAGYFPAITRKKGESFEATLARVHAVMEDHKSKQEELGQLVILELAATLGNVAMRILGPLVTPSLDLLTYSNIGIVDPSIANFGDVEVREILPAGPMLSAPCFILGSHTFNGEMALTSSVWGTEEHKAMIESLFEALVRELPEYGEDSVDTVREEIMMKMPVMESAETYIREKSVSDA